MTSKHFTVSKALARNLKGVADRMKRGGGIPHELVVQEMLRAMGKELQKMARAFERTGRGAKDLLEKLALAEVEGVDPRVLAEIRRRLGERVRRRRAA